MPDSALHIRAIQPQDFAAWLPLWDGYNAFYGREGETALDPAITQTTWRRFFDAAEPVHGLVAERDGELLGLVHYLYHRSTTALDRVCYLQDLFTAASARGQGVGRALMQAVFDAAKDSGLKRVYWHTYETNTTARLLYDQVGRHAGAIVYSRQV